jgi:hypothetical protein
MGLTNQRQSEQMIQVNTVNDKITQIELNIYDNFNNLYKLVLKSDIRVKIDKIRIYCELYKCYLICRRNKSFINKELNEIKLIYIDNFDIWNDEEKRLIDNIIKYIIDYKYLF